MPLYHACASTRDFLQRFDPETAVVFEVYDIGSPVGIIWASSNVRARWLGKIGDLTLYIA